MNTVILLIAIMVTISLVVGVTLSAIRALAQTSTLETKIEEKLDLALQVLEELRQEVKIFKAIALKKDDRGEVA